MSDETMTATFSFWN